MSPWLVRALTATVCAAAGGAPAASRLLAHRAAAECGRRGVRPYPRRPRSRCRRTRCATRTHACAPIPWAAVGGLGDEPAGDAVDDDVAVGRRDAHVAAGAADRRGAVAVLTMTSLSIAPIATAPVPVTTSAVPLAAATLMSPAPLMTFSGPVRSRRIAPAPLLKVDSPSTPSLRSSPTLVLPSTREPAGRAIDHFDGAGTRPAQALAQGLDEQAGRRRARPAPRRRRARRPCASRRVGGSRRPCHRARSR